MNVLEVNNISKTFYQRNGISIKAVDNVSFSLESGKTMGLMGPSGCGKSTICRIVMGICKPDSGCVTVVGKDVYKNCKSKYNNEIQMIFQNPVAALNPSYTAKETLFDYFKINKGDFTNEQISKKISDVMEMVQLEQSCLQRFPHELSGGQCQRLCIARALLPSPKIIICDEITSALDVSVQAHLINILLELQKEMGVAYLFISHDIDIVRHMSDNIAVMDNGRIKGIF